MGTSFFVCSLLVLSTALGQSDTASVQCLTQGKKVIPLYSQCGKLWTTQVKLPDLLVINRGSDPITVTDVEVTGLAEGREVAVNRIAEDLPQVVRQVNEQFRKLLGDGVLNVVSDPSLQIPFGNMLFAGTTLSKTEAISRNESAVVLLSNLAFFSYTGQAKIDDLRVKVVLKQGTQTKNIPCPIDFTPYQSKGDYIFPLKGDLCINNLPMDLANHRGALSQEFAFDVIGGGLLKNEGGELSLDSLSATGKTERHALSDYPIFRREVMAAGNGVVVEVGDKFPESLVSDPSKFSEQYSSELRTKLEPEIGLLNCLAGNYIVIDHENGEFSAYCHLSEGSIRVKPGDRVTKGDVIAAVGNTGHSSEPHLHLQLMDSKDFMTANGLPVMFSNVPPNVINQDCKAANSLLVTDFIMFRIAE